MITKKLEILGGVNIQAAAEEAVAEAKRGTCIVEFEFNDITLSANPDSTPDELVQSFKLQCDTRRAAWEASDEYKKQQEDMKVAQTAREAAFAAALDGAPEKMTLQDEAGWNSCVSKNSDPYGSAAVQYAERWARMMEKRIAKGENLTTVAEECSHLADVEGITGFMYGCAVSILSKVWIHGEELRKWHNLKTQIGTEGEKANENGGVLNPALLTVGT